MRILLVTLAALLLFVLTLAEILWWAQPVAAFFGRRIQWDAGDFATLYCAGRLVVTGHSHKLFDLDALTAIRRADTSVPSPDKISYLNPPFFAAVLAPFALLPFGLAYQVWIGISVALIAATCCMVWRITSSLPKWQRGLLIFAFVASYPVTFALRLGQFSMILLASWTLAYVLLRRGRDRAAGVALAALLIKPELLIPVAAFLFWKKRYAVFITLAPLTVVAVAASFAVAGPAEGLHYPLFILDNARNSAHGTRTDLMFGWNGLLSAFVGPKHPLTATLLSAPMVALTLAATAMVWRGQLCPEGRHFPRQWLLLTLATVLVDPNFFLQDIVIVAPAAFALLSQTEGRGRAAMGAAVAVGWVLFGLGFQPTLRWHINLVAIYMVAGFAALVLQAAREPSALRAVVKPAQFPGLEGGSKVA